MGLRTARFSRFWRNASGLLRITIETIGISCTLAKKRPNQSLDNSEGHRCHDHGSEPLNNCDKRHTRWLKYNVANDPWTYVSKVVVLVLLVGRAVERIILFNVSNCDLSRPHEAHHEVHGESRFHGNKWRLVVWSFAWIDSTVPSHAHLSLCAYLPRM